MESVNGAAVQPFEAWIIQRGKAELLTRGENKAAVDRALRHHSGAALIARDGCVLSARGSKSEQTALTSAMEAARKAAPAPFKVELSVASAKLTIETDEPANGCDADCDGDGEPERAEPAPVIPTSPPTAATPTATATESPSAPAEPLGPESFGGSDFPPEDMTEAERAHDAYVTAHEEHELREAAEAAEAAPVDVYAIPARVEAVAAFIADLPKRPAVAAEPPVVLRVPEHFGRDLARLARLVERVGGIDALEGLVDMAMRIIEGTET